MMILIIIVCVLFIAEQLYFITITSVGRKMLIEFGYKS